ncbi:condensation protein [Paracoccus aurantiacus]|uniref:Condensation protein n=1 Tax=Paracoccus aurantiacus TaxID=2599412 RepID=A0A5C6RUL1_9RHOB|nr:condensation domain-containing protein [Paracoccus aurantiacus]TXB65685.1 condensation protein [Paracoccus aurantiacus]
MNKMVSPTSPLPLTLGQLDFWEEFLAHPGQPVSTVAHLIRLHGPLNHDAIAQAITMMAAEADVLSLQFLDGDPPMQIVDPDRLPGLRQLDLRSHPAPEDEARRIMQADIDHPLDLCAAPLSALWLIRLSEDHWIWYLRGHHIFLDGYSMALIEKRVAQLYAHIAQGAPAGKSFARFGDYLAEEADYRGSPRHQSAREFWQRQLAAGHAPATLRKGSEGYPVVPHSATIPLQHLSARLLQSAQRFEMGWPDLVTALCTLWLWRVPASDARDNGLVWLPLMGRLGSVAANIPAMVLNIAPFRVTPNPREGLAAVLGAMQQDLRSVRKHGRCRIEQIAADFGLKDDERFFFSPLINVMPFSNAHFPGGDCEREVLAAGPGDGFNVTISADPRAEGMVMHLDADPSLTSRTLFDRHVAGLPDFLNRCLSADANLPLLRAFRDEGAG